MEDAMEIALEFMKNIEKAFAVLYPDADICVKLSSIPDFKSVVIHDMKADKILATIKIKE